MRKSGKVGVGSAQMKLHDERNSRAISHSSVLIFGDFSSRRSSNILTAGFVTAAEVNAAAGDSDHMLKQKMLTTGYQSTRPTVNLSKCFMETRSWKNCEFVPRVSAGLSREHLYLNCYRESKDSRKDGVQI